MSIKLGNISFSEFQESFEQNDGNVVIQTVIGRSGSLFMQSLFDNHPEVLMFPGILNYYEIIWPSIINNKNNWKQILKEKIDFWVKVMVPYNIHINLGNNGDETIEIKSNEIIDLLEKTVNINEVDSRLFFLALHYSIGICYNKNLRPIKIIYCHEHTSFLSTSFVDSIIFDFPKVYIFSIVRDPRSNYLSIKNWETKRYNEDVDIWKNQKFQYSVLINMCIDWYINYLTIINKYPKNFIVFRLEDVNIGQEAFIKRLCHHINIRFNTTLLDTTFDGKLWSGDNFSPKKSNFRVVTKSGDWRNNLTLFKKCIIEMLLKNEIVALEYNLLFKKNPLVKIFFLFILPFWNIEGFRFAFRNYLLKESNRFRRLGVIFCLLKFFVGEINRNSSLVFQSRKFDNIKLFK